MVDVSSHYQNRTLSDHYKTTIDMIGPIAGATVTNEELEAKLSQGQMSYGGFNPNFQLTPLKGHPRPTPHRRANPRSYNRKNVRPHERPGRAQNTNWSKDMPPAPKRITGRANVEPHYATVPLQNSFDPYGQVAYTMQMYNQDNPDQQRNTSRGFFIADVWYPNEEMLRQQTAIEDTEAPYNRLTNRRYYGNYNPPPAPMENPAVNTLLRIKEQLEFYFSSRNISHDSYMQRAMDYRGYIPAEELSRWRRLAEKHITEAMILEAAKLSSKLKVKNGKLRRVSGWYKYTSLPPDQWQDSDVEEPDYVKHRESKTSREETKEVEDIDVYSSLVNEIDEPITP